MKTTTPWTERWNALRLRQVTFDSQTRHNIQQAAEEYRVQPGLIASILADERLRLDLADRVQDKLLRLGERLPEAWRARLLHLLEKALGRSAETFSLGQAQMKGTTLQRLATSSYVSVKDDVAARRALLLSRRQAPRLVAACLRATADHWQAGGVNLESRPDVLGTLYSIGLTGKQGVHAHPVATARGQAIADHARWLETSTFGPDRRCIATPV